MNTLAEVYEELEVAAWSLRMLLTVIIGAHTPIPISAAKNEEGRAIRDVSLPELMSFNLIAGEDVEHRKKIMAKAVNHLLKQELIVVKEFVTPNWEKIYPLLKKKLVRSVTAEEERNLRLEFFCDE